MAARNHVKCDKLEQRNSHTVTSLPSTSSEFHLMVCPLPNDIHFECYSDMWFDCMCRDYALSCARKSAVLNGRPWTGLSASRSADLKASVSPSSKTLHLGKDQ